MRLIFALALTLCLLPFSPALAYKNSGEERTANRSLFGMDCYPEWFTAKPLYDEFRATRSHFDTQNSHPAQWEGMDWDPAQWHKDWTPETAIRKFYAIGVFHAQYLDGKVPVLELGPTFYKISDLDRRRMLKLLTDHAEVFGRGFGAVALRDWRSKKEIGIYTVKGMQLY